MNPAPVGGLPASFCRSLLYLFTDIDDTITTDGMLPSLSYDALWNLSRAGIQVVPVTGRPAGWCDHIARMWPVSAVIGENGAFYYAYDRAARRMTRRGLAGSADAEGERRELLRVAARVLREVPGTALAADQPFRVSDVAIDYCEDVPPLGADAIDAICRVLDAEEVTWRVSSIHVNFWRGRFDKLTGVRTWLSDREGADGVDEALKRALFIGDSPNDEPLFAGFSVSVAVANLKRWMSRLKSLPGYMTDADSAAGFCEACGVILAKRRER